MLLLSTACVQTIHGELVCTEPGLFSIPGSCQEYYECRMHRGQLYTIPEICEEGSLYDDIQAKCVSENLVTSPLQCVTVTAATEESILEANTETNNFTIQGVAEKNTPKIPEANQGTGIIKVSVEAGSGDTVVEELTVCDHEKIVDSYASLVTGSPFLVESFDYKKQYHNLIIQYNRDLEKAKNNIPLWRQGDSIVNGLKNTYYKASEYKNELQRKIDILNEQLHIISNRTADPKFSQILEKDIKTLRQGIKDAQEALAMADVPQVQKYFEGVIASKTQEIEQKLKELKSNSKDGAILRELLDFLGFMKDDFNEISNLSDVWQGKMGELLYNFREDAAAFAEQSSLANEAINTLTGDYDIQQQNLNENTVRQQQLENRQEVLNADVGILTGKNEELSRRILKLLEVIENKTSVYNRRRESLCQPTGALAEYINASSTVESLIAACNLILGRFSVYLDVDAEQAQVNQLRRETRANRELISGKLDELESINNELRTLFGALSPYTERKEEIEIELNDLRSHASETENLTEGVNAAITSLIKIREVLQVVQELFGTGFQNLIDQGSAADNDVDRRNLINFIDRVIGNVKDNLERVTLPNLNRCI